MSESKKSHKRRRHEEHEEHEAAHDEPWLVSYADMMTLLFGFFVVMYSFASKEKSGAWEKARRQLAKFFGQEYVTPYDKVEESIKKVIQSSEMKDEIEFLRTPEGIEITFRSSLLFLSGRETLEPKAMPLVDNLVAIIASKKKSLALVVEGHTDDVPINSPRFPSNWELSAARAASIIRLFEDAGFYRHRMQAVAFADTKPVMKNRDENDQPILVNQALNRRVVIKLLTVMEEPEAASPNQKPPEPRGTAPPAPTSPDGG